MKKKFLTLSFTIACFCGVAITHQLQAQNTTTNTSLSSAASEKPVSREAINNSEMPKPANYKTNTEYSQAKKAWIAANPDKYKATTQKSGKIQISKAELDKMPADRAAQIRSNPDKYFIK